MAEPVRKPGPADPIEVVPVVVLSQVFPARPSSIPDIRDFVRRCLAESPLTEAAARQVGVSVKTVSRWVGGATEPRMRDLRRIQEVFGEVPLP